MRRKEPNHIILVEKSIKSFQRKLKGYGKVYLYEGSFKKARKLPYDFMDAIDYFTAQYKANENIDWVCSQYVSGLEINTFEDITKDKRSHLIVEKEILAAIEKIFFSFALAEKFIEKYKIKEGIDFIPKGFSYEMYQIIRQKQGLLSDRMHIPSWYLQRLKRQDFIKRLVFRSAIRLYPLLISLSMWGKRVKKKKNYKWGLHIWDTYMNSICQYFVNILVKENRIDDKNLLYVIDNKITKENLEKIKFDGHSYCSFVKMVKDFSFRSYIKEILPLAIKKQKGILSCVSKKALLTRVYFRTLRSYIFWEMFYKIYQVDNFISIQDSGGVTRALLQKLHGSKNTFVYLSSCCLPREVEGVHSQIITQYNRMAYDYLISSKISIDFFKQNNNQIDEYKDAGILLSSVVFRIRQNELLKKEIKRNLGIPEDKIVISYFDTAIGKLGWFSDVEAAQILEDILKLLNSHKEYFLIYKPKKDYRRFPRNSLMQREVKKLIGFERVLYVDRFKQKYQAQHIMGISNLVISAFTSSAGFEAIAGGVKTIYYALNDRYNNDVFAVNRCPRFFAYVYQQLKEYVDYWVNQCGEGEFRDFQEQYIKRYVDTFCDGMALDRLEEILKERKVVSNKGNLEGQTLEASKINLGLRR